MKQASSKLKFFKILMIAAMLGVLTFASPGISIACDSCEEEVGDTMNDETTATKTWMTTDLWASNLLPALMRMADQLTAVSMKQVEIFGQFLDAKHQLETQQVFQRMTAQMHKDYHPSVGMCEFGSGAKSLASSERRGEVNSIMMSARSIDRNTGHANTAAAVNQAEDRLSRLKQFREKFCNPRDNNHGLEQICDHDQNIGAGSTVGALPPTGIGAPSTLPAAPAGTPPTPPTPGAPAPLPQPHPYERMNKDIDYVRTMDAPWTLDINFTDTTLTQDEEEVMALASNLYSNEIFFRPPPEMLAFGPGNSVTDYQLKYMDARAIMAKRSVAQNSFNALTAMKSAGTPGSHDYLFELIRQLASPPANATQQEKDQQLNELRTLLGNNPSYNAQMEVLTKKIYQNPDFYTNLYDKPVNVERKQVAMQAIGLMQKFDLYKSYLRNEASLSVLLELEVDELQQEVENEFGRIKPTGSPPPR